MINKIFEKIKSAKNILIITHVNPDPDTLASAAALKSFIGDKADILCQVPANSTVFYTYDFIPYIKTAYNFDTLKTNYDTVICVDVASYDRISDTAKAIFENAKVTIQIDHHKTNKGYAEINYVKGGISSTGEILYEMFTEKGIKITPEIAKCLYISILTDTGCFKYETVTKRTFEIASNLTECNIDTAQIARLCYDSKSKPMVLFQAYCVSNAKFLCGDKVIYCTIKQKDMDKFGAKDEHTDGIAETLRSIKSVEFACVLKENSNGTTKVSLRSKEKDVTKIVSAFNGGGHTRAAGCTIKKPLDAALVDLTNEIIRVFYEKTFERIHD